jgi:hypothetical protein
MRSGARARTEAPTLRDGLAIGHQRFDVGPHHRPEPRSLGVSPELVGRAAPAAQSLAQPLQGEVQADLVAVAEAIDDGFGGTVDRDFDVFDQVAFDAFAFANSSSGFISLLGQRSIYQLRIQA